MLGDILLVIDECSDYYARQTGCQIVRGLRPAHVGAASAEVGQIDGFIRTFKLRTQIFGAFIQGCLACQVACLLRLVANAARRVDDTSESALDHFRKHEITDDGNRSEIRSKAQIEIGYRSIEKVLMIADLNSGVI